MRPRHPASHRPTTPASTHSYPRSHGPLPLRLLLRLAARLQVAWGQKPTLHPDDGDWNTLDARLRAINIARYRWQLGHEHPLPLLLPELGRDFRITLNNLSLVIDRLRSRLDESYADEPDPAPSLGHWLAELRQLDEEFDDLTVDWQVGTIRVSTHSITLNDVDLGRFAIVFGWKRLGQISGIRCFDVLALDPNPASGKDGVTHPHVRDEELCAGDASRPVNDALRDGRLADAFLLIRSVLTHYNAKSPYVPLEDWNGTPCSECGSSVDPDQSSSCDACHSTLCDSCICSCAVCSDYRCGSCLQRCDACHDGCCPGCLERVEDRPVCPECRDNCSECGAPVLKEDLTADTKLCPACHTKHEEESTHDETEPSGTTASPDPVPIPTAIPPFPDVLCQSLAEMAVSLPCRAD